jgi:DNA-binding NarL/FixJ family response regulator
MYENEISKVFIADDHPLFRCGLRLSLNQKENIEVVGEADNGFKAVERILSGHPDIALIDVDMPGLSGIGTGWAPKSHLGEPVRDDCRRETAE